MLAVENAKCCYQKRALKGYLVFVCAFFLIHTHAHTSVTHIPHTHRHSHTQPHTHSHIHPPPHTLSHTSHLHTYSLTHTSHTHTYTHTLSRRGCSGDTRHPGEPCLGSSVASHCDDPRSTNLPGDPGWQGGCRSPDPHGGPGWWALLDPPPTGGPPGLGDPLGLALATRCQSWAPPKQ